MDLGRLYLFVAFLACPWIATLDALPTKGPHSAAQEAQSRPHWQYPRGSNTTLGNATTIWAVACVYPVSGIYTRMQRLLLYAVTALVFLLRSHDWLITVGMTFVLTYASAACIHALLLSTLHGIGPDLDALVLQGIIMSTTMAVFSYSMVSRRISEYAIAPLFYIWISAMLVTSVASGLSINGILGDLNTFIIPAGCSDDGKCNLGACSNATSHGLFRSEMDQLVPIALDEWTYHNTNVLGDQGGYYPFSGYGSNMVDLWVKAPLYYMYAWYYWLVTAFVVTRLLFSPLLFNPSKSRNVLFLHSLIRRSKTFGTPFYRDIVLLSPLLGSPLLRLSLYRIVLRGADTEIGKRIDSFLLWNVSIPSEVEFEHIDVVKLLTSCWFVCSWSARIILLMLPVVTVVLSELTLAGLPESEAPRLVGQWAPFVYVGLALLASLILKFLNSRRIGVQEQRRLTYLSYTDSTEPLKFPLHCLTEKYERNLLLSPCLAWKEFKVWWNDPVNVAKQDYEDVRRQLRFELMVARRRVAKRRQKDLSCVGDDEVAVPVSKEPVERLEFDKIWKQLLASASGSQNHRDWATQFPSTFKMCRQDHNGDSLVDTGWITATYDEEEYEEISTAEIRRREAKFQKDREDREQLADSLEPFIRDVLEFGGFELR